MRLKLHAEKKGITMGKFLRDRHVVEPLGTRAMFVCLPKEFLAAVEKQELTVQRYIQWLGLPVKTVLDFFGGITVSKETQKICKKFVDNAIKDFPFHEEALTSLFETKTAMSKARALAKAQAHIPPKKARLPKLHEHLRELYIEGASLREMCNKRAGRLMGTILDTLGSKEMKLVQIPWSARNTGLPSVLNENFEYESIQGLGGYCDLYGANPEIVSKAFAGYHKKWSFDLQQFCYGIEQDFPNIAKDVISTLRVTMGLSSRVPKVKTSIQEVRARLMNAPLRVAKMPGNAGFEATLEGIPKICGHGRTRKAAIESCENVINHISKGGII